MKKGENDKGRAAPNGSTGSVILGLEPNQPCLVNMFCHSLPKNIRLRNLNGRARSSVLNEREGF